MRGFIVSLSWVLAATWLAFGAGPLAAQDGTKAQTFTDWQLNCPEGGACRMAQTVVQPATARAIVQLKIFAGDTPTMLVTMPLGVLLAPGWRYAIDTRAESVTPYEICNTTGCHTGLPLSPALVRAMKRGRTLRINFYDAAQNPVSPEVSLLGFTKAWEKLVQSK